MVNFFWEIKKKTHKIYKNKILFKYLNSIFIGYYIFDKGKKNHFKRTRFNFNISKVHTYDLINIS